MKKNGWIWGMTVLLSWALLGTASAAENANSANDRPLSRAEFVATISDYFGWVHSADYVDYAKVVQKNFVDVRLSQTKYGKQIEMALEESLIDNASGYFYPERPMRRQDAAQIFVRAFKIPHADQNALAKFTDAADVSAENQASLNALVAAGYMQGVSAGRLAPNATLSHQAAASILKNITAAMVTPVQVMPKPGTTSARRYVNMTTPTAGAKIFYTYTLDGSEPADPVSAGKEYLPNRDGFLLFVNPNNSTTDRKLYKLKAVAMKNGMATSPVQNFMWDIYRPLTGKFEAKLIHAPTSTSPAVWMMYNTSESVAAHAFYIEGSKRGLVFDALQYPFNKANLKELVDTLATKPYDIIVGHHHLDHVEQVSNFTSAGVQFYATDIEKAVLLASGRADYIAAAKSSLPLNDGDVFDLGNVKITAYQAPGHTNGLVVIQEKSNGWIFSTDMLACNRPYTADITNYAGIKMDLFVSMNQQLVSNFKKHGGKITEVYNAHQEVPVNQIGLHNFQETAQQLIDRGDAASTPAIRGGNQRMSIVGDMWRDKNWMAIWPGGIYGGPVTYLSKPTSAYPIKTTIDYTVTDGYKKYALLSNIEIAGGELVGVDIFWAPPANGVPNVLHNKFDPWTTDYTIKVAPGTKNILFTPTALSSKVKSMTLDGAPIVTGSSHSIAVAAGKKIIVTITAPDGTTRSTYNFTLETI